MLVSELVCESCGVSQKSRPLIQGLGAAEISFVLAKLGGPLEKTVLFKDFYCLILHGWGFRQKRLPDRLDLPDVGRRERRAQLSQQVLSERFRRHQKNLPEGVRALERLR